MPYFACPTESDQCNDMLEDRADPVLHMFALTPIFEERLTAGNTNAVDRLSAERHACLALSCSTIHNVSSPCKYCNFSHTSPTSQMRVSYPST